MTCQTPLPLDWIADHVRRYRESNGADGHMWTPPGGRQTRADAAAHDDGAEVEAAPGPAADLREDRERLCDRRVEGRRAVASRVVSQPERRSGCRGAGRSRRSSPPRARTATGSGAQPRSGSRWPRCGRPTTTISARPARDSGRRARAALTARIDMIETRFTKLVGASAPIQVAAMPGVTTRRARRRGRRRGRGRDARSTALVARVPRRASSSDWRRPRAACSASTS